MNITIPNTNSYFLKDRIEEIVAIIEDSGILLYPTDTIWGVGCDACDPVAIERIYNLKKRDRSKPFVLLVDSIEMLRNYVESVHPRIETLLSFHSRPLTVIYEQGANLPENAMSSSGSVAIRIVKDKFCQQLIRTLGKPLIATSANISDAPFPANFGEISSDIIQGVEYVVHHRRDDREQRAPSVIIKYNKKGDLTFIRT